MPVTVTRAVERRDIELSASPMPVLVALFRLPVVLLSASSQLRNLGCVLRALAVQALHLQVSLQAVEKAVVGSGDGSSVFLYISHEQNSL